LRFSSGFFSIGSEMNGTRLPHVMFVADKLGYPGGVSYGITTYCLNVLPALVATGVPLTACFFREPHPAGEALEALGVRTVFLSARKFDPTVLRSLVSLARKHRSEILHAAGYASTLMARLTTRFLPARAVLHAHDLHRPGLAIRALEAALSRHSDTGVCVSHAAREVAAAVYRLPPENVRVIHNGIDIDRFRDILPGARARVRAELGIPSAAPVIGIVARIYAVKGHRALIAMMPEVLTDLPDARLLIVGDGPDRSSCEAMVDKLGLRQRVIFTGQREDVAELLCGCDAFAMPSDSEGLPMSAIESLAMGVPVVGYDVGGVSEVVHHGYTGCLVEHGDTAAFVLALISLLKNPLTHAAWSENARAAADRFGIARHVRQLVDLYTELATGGVRR
jgi:glycosyltransferase involved in cell wall biosynthesis